MKTHFDIDDFYVYYLRREDHEPFGCIVLRQDKDGNWSRGISLCSDQDQFSKDKAKKIAKDRCVHAICTKQSTDIIKATDRDVVRYDVGSWYLAPKSGYAVELSEKEKQITASNDKPVFSKEAI